MGNMLTHGLLAGALMAVANVIIGIEPVFWNVFLAAIISISLNLDSGDGRTAPGSPACHSIGCGIFIVYLAGTGAYLLWSFSVLEASLALALVLAVAIGVMAHFMAEMLTGEQVFTIPENMRPETWVVKCDCRSERFWSAWGRISLKRWRVRDSHLNALSLSVIIGSIWLFPQPF